MSFAVSIPITPREDFSAAVAATPAPPGLSEAARLLFEKARSHAAEIADAFPEGDRLAASFSGYVGGEDGYEFTSVTVTVTDPVSRAPVGPMYADNGDGTWTRSADGIRGHFTPLGFVEIGPVETVSLPPAPTVG